MWPLVNLMLFRGIPFVTCVIFLLDNSNLGSRKCSKMFNNMVGGFHILTWSRTMNPLVVALGGADRESRGKHGRGSLMNVQYNPIWSCHNESPLNNKYNLIKIFKCSTIILGTFYLHINKRNTCFKYFSMVQFLLWPLW
jgi:hypothetical protein